MFAVFNGNSDLKLMSGFDLNGFRSLRKNIETHNDQSRKNVSVI